MRRFSVATVVFALAIGTAASARAEAPQAKRPVVTHYRTLEKMLRRFSRQAGAPSPDGRRVLAAR